jgi:hypothetical protein
MKPQLTMQDTRGQHNLNPNTNERLSKSGSWKKQRIIVILPADDMIPAKVALSHWSLIFPPNNAVVRILAQGLEVGEAYSNSIEQVLNHPELSKWEYILTMEHDNMPPNDGVMKLLERMEEHKELSCIGGLYYTKGEGGVPQIWGDINDPVVNFRPQIPIPGKLVECMGTGMGFNLWRLKMFKDPELEKPWFQTAADKSGVGTQDLRFWANARKFGYRCAIDCSVLVGHYDHTTDTVW